MKRSHLLPFALIIAFLSSCAPSNSVVTGESGVHPSEDALLWHQTSAEYDALCFQAFNVARNRIDQILNGFTDMPLQDRMAVIMDLDETVLDNSAYSVKMMQEGKRFSEESWNEWVFKKEAGIVPGADEFIAYCIANNIQVFFISNRDISTRTATIQNLAALGIEAGTDNLFLKEGNTKAERRERLNDYSVLLLIGDNLADFDAQFEDKLDVKERSELIFSQFSNDFGNKFILLPNPLYGDWMNAIEKSARTREDQLKLLKSYPSANEQ
jgi:5'-nucleotidase (lipoprotein e(P4) family)